MISIDFTSLQQVVHSTFTFPCVVPIFCGLTLWLAVIKDIQLVGNLCHLSPNGSVPEQVEEETSRNCYSRIGGGGIIWPVHEVASGTVFFCISRT